MEKKSLDSIQERVARIQKAMERGIESLGMRIGERHRGKSNREDNGYNKHKHSGLAATEVFPVRGVTGLPLHSAQPRFYAQLRLFLLLLKRDTSK